jgi:hypothetical protein
MPASIEEFKKLNVCMTGGGYVELEEGGKEMRTTMQRRKGG